MMNIDLGFSDLNIPVSGESSGSLKELVLRAFELGYQTVALNTVVDQDTLMTKKQQTKKGVDNKLSEFPLPTRLELSESDYPPGLQNKGFKHRILTRLTLIVTNNDFLIHFNKSTVVQQYDLLAVIPRTTQTLLTMLKSSFRWDIVSLDPDLIVGGMRWSRKLYLECVEKHVHFELVYGPAIRNTEDRRRIISLAHNYHAVGKSKNIFFSSGAKSSVELRSPEDVANLAFIFGMNETQGKEAVRGKCLAIYRAAVGRKMGPYRVRIEKCQPGLSSEKDSDSTKKQDDGQANSPVIMETDA